VPLLSLAWGVGQIGLPFNENGSIEVFGLDLPLQSDSTIIASLAPALPLAGALRLRVEDIAPAEDAAAAETSALSTLVNLARGVTEPLADNAANRALKDLLKTADVTRDRNRVLIKATLPPSFFESLTSENLNSPPQATPHQPPASH
jgi:hypothetical protein